MTAYWVVEAAHERDLRVPEELSMAGFDGTQLAARMHPRLTTVRQDVVAKGATAARALVCRIEGGTGRAKRVCLPVELVVGESTAPAPDQDAGSRRKTVPDRSST